MAKKLFKYKYTDEELSLIHNLIVKEGMRIDYWWKDLDSGSYSIVLNEDVKTDMRELITKCNQIYHKLESKNKLVIIKVVLRSNGCEIPIYKQESNQGGITYEIIEYAKNYKDNKVIGISNYVYIIKYKNNGELKEEVSNSSYKNKAMAHREATKRINEIVKASNSISTFTGMKLNKNDFIIEIGTSGI